MTPPLLHFTTSKYYDALVRPPAQWAGINLTLNGNLSSIAAWSNNADEIAHGDGPLPYTPTTWWTVGNVAAGSVSSTFNAAAHNEEVGIEYITISDRIFDEVLWLGSYGIIGVYTTIVLGEFYFIVLRCGSRISSFR